MILKPRKKPLPLQKLEAAIPRVSSIPLKLADMKKDYAKRMKGYIGEKKVDYQLEPLASQASILQGFVLSHCGKKFEIDTLLITHHAGYIIEGKNYNGTITFDTVLKQFFRDNGALTEGYRYPITQVKAQSQKLIEWLKSYQLTQLPIYYYIAISDPSTIVKVIGNQEAIAQVVGHAEHIPNMILENEAKFKRTNRETFNHRKIGELILMNSTDYNRDILADYGLTPQDLAPGVRCPSCGYLGMTRIHKYWLCPQCQHKSRYAHQAALRDYFLLVQPWISNKICMYWLKINSRNLATRILKESNLAYDSKSRIWRVKRNGM